MKFFYVNEMEENESDALFLFWFNRKDLQHFQVIRDLLYIFTNIERAQNFECVQTRFDVKNILNEGKTQCYF